MSSKDQFGNEIEYSLLPRESFDRKCAVSGCTTRNFDNGYAALYSSNQKAFVYIEGDVICITGSDANVQAAVEQRTSEFEELL